MDRRVTLPKARPTRMRFSSVTLPSVMMRPRLCTDASRRIATQRIQNASVWGGCKVKFRHLPFKIIVNVLPWQEKHDGVKIGDQLQVEKSFVLFFKTIVFNALIPNILLSWLSDEQKYIFSHLKSADFETVCDWSTSPWRNNLDIPWCNNLVMNLMT